jgi:hypothetical protein
VKSCRRRGAPAGDGSGVGTEADAQERNNVSDFLGEPVIKAPEVSIPGRRFETVDSIFAGPVHTVLKSTPFEARK